MKKCKKCGRDILEGHMCESCKVPLMKAARNGAKIMGVAAIGILKVGINALGKNKNQS